MTETKDWAAFFNDIDADDKNKVSITLEGFYSGILDDDKFTLEDTALLKRSSETVIFGSKVQAILASTKAR